MTELRFAVIGNPPTVKKNSQRILKKRDGGRFIAPPERYTAWVDSAAFALPDGRFALQAPPWKGGLCNMEAHFYVAAEDADVDNLYCALGDLLQARGCYPNDSIIRSWDRSRVHVDAISPRVEVVITEFVE